MLKITATMKIKLDMTPSFAKNRLLPAVISTGFPPLDAWLASCLHDVQATKPDSSAKARHTRLSEANNKANPSQSGADKGV